jgi:hypothetical protein
MKDRFDEDRLKIIEGNLEKSWFNLTVTLLVY